MRDSTEPSRQVKLSGLVPVAGLSSRMGDFKPLMPLGDATVIENTVLTLIEAGAERVSVVTGYRAGEVENVLAHRFGERVIMVRNERYAETDMLESIRMGCRSLPRCDAFFLLPGDMPAVQPETLARVRNAWEQRGGIVFPTLNGRRKHPPLVSYELANEIASFRCEGGLHQFWNTCQNPTTEVAVDDYGTQIDLDYPHDYAKCKELLGLAEHEEGSCSRKRYYDLRRQSEREQEFRF